MRIELKELVGGAAVVATAVRNGDAAECVRLEVVGPTGKRAECHVALEVTFQGRARLSLRIRSRDDYEERYVSRSLPWILNYEPAPRGGGAS